MKTLIWIVTGRDETDRTSKWCSQICNLKASSVFNKIQRNGKYSRAGKHIVVLRIIASNREIKWHQQAKNRARMSTMDTKIDTFWPDWLSSFVHFEGRKSGFLLVFWKNQEFFFLFFLNVFNYEGKRFYFFFFIITNKQNALLWGPAKP